LKEALLNPDDKGKKDTLKATVAQEEAALASIVAAANPTVDNKLKAAALKELADLARLNSAHSNGDPKAVEAALNDLRGSNALLLKASKAHAGRTDNQGKKHELKVIVYCKKFVDL
jgi:multidrug efflux pump subunit AcrA (membrane-fusion protein)